jgi:hypothetical protein
LFLEPFQQPPQQRVALLLYNLQMLGLVWKKHRPPAVAAAPQGLPLLALALQRELSFLGFMLFKLIAGLKVFPVTKLVRF